MLKNFLIKKLLEKQLSALPPDMREMIMTAIEKNPEFFTKMAVEIKRLQDLGKNQSEIATCLQKTYSDEIGEIFRKKSI